MISLIIFAFFIFIAMLIFTPFLRLLAEPLLRHATPFAAAIDLPLGFAFAAFHFGCRHFTIFAADFIRFRLFRHFRFHYASFADFIFATPDYFLHCFAYLRLSTHALEKVRYVVA